MEILLVVIILILLFGAAAFRGAMIVIAGVAIIACGAVYVLYITDMDPIYFFLGVMVFGMAMGLRHHFWKR